MMVRIHDVVRHGAPSSSLARKHPMYSMLFRAEDTGVLISVLHRPGR